MMLTGFILIIGVFILGFITAEVRRAFFMANEIGREIEEAESRNGRWL